MTRLPTLDARKITRALRRAGFFEVRHTGSHLIFTNQKQTRFVTVSIHGGQDIKRGTLKGILGQAGLSEDEFLALL